MMKWQTILVISSAVYLMAGWAMADEPDEQVSTLVRWSSTPLVGDHPQSAAQGVSLRVDGETLPQVIPWYDVRSLDHADAGYYEFIAVAKEAWRAHARLIRGDYSGAEPLYLALADRYLWKSGPESADVSSGLLHCRLDRDARAHAVLPFLSWLGTTQNNESETTQSTIAKFNSEYGVVVELPPFFLSGDDAGAMELGDAIELGSRQQLLWDLYHLALDLRLHRTQEATEILSKVSIGIRESHKKDAGLRFVADMVIAQTHAHAEQRSEARISLDRRVRAHRDTWIELWARLAIGASLLEEPDHVDQQRGAIELIHVIVRLDDVSKPLAILASQRLNKYFVRTNQAQWGSELMLEAKNDWSNK